MFRVIDELHPELRQALLNDVARRLMLMTHPIPSASNEPDERHGHIALGAHRAHANLGTHARSTRKSCTLACWQERRAKELLESNVTSGITLAELASACELSVRHFTRAFRGSTGMSPHAWLLRLRLEMAQKLLENAGRDLVDIAIDCGFADQSHLTRSFQRYAGMSPGAWRRLHRR
jgi:transcriptional regulator GlxA family with amidase domain